MTEYSFDPYKTAMENLADSARLSYVRGNPDDYADWNEQDRIELSKPLGYIYDLEEVPSRFNRIIESHATRWSKTPIEERTKRFYAHKYESLLEDIYRFLEKCPSGVEPKGEYWKLVEAERRYAKREDYFLDVELGRYPDPSQWRNV